MATNHQCRWCFLPLLRRSWEHYPREPPYSDEDLADYHGLKITVWASLALPHWVRVYSAATGVYGEWWRRSGGALHPCAIRVYWLGLLPRSALPVETLWLGSPPGSEPIPTP